MDGFLTEPIILSGEQSLKFIEAMRNPSQEYLGKVTNVFASMDRDINIKRKEMDFEVEIDGIDLSFINELEDNDVKAAPDSSIELNTKFVFTLEHISGNFLAGIGLGGFETVSVIQIQEQDMTKLEPRVYIENSIDCKSASVKNKDNSLSSVCQMMQIVFAA